MAAAKKTSAKKATSKKTSAKKGSAKKAPGKKAAPVGLVECGKWTAFHDHQPPGPATLRVTGVCVAPTPGYRIRLVAAVPQGFNPKILLLQKIVTPPKGIRPQVRTKVEVRYTKRTSFEYTHVTILPDGKTIKVKDVF